MNARTWPWADLHPSSDWPWLHTSSTSKTPAKGVDYRVFSPPMEYQLYELAKAGVFPEPLQCEVYKGSEDWHSHTDVISEFFELIGVNAVIAQGRNHMLREDHVGTVLDRWLGRMSNRNSSLRFPSQ